MDVERKIILTQLVLGTIIFLSLSGFLVLVVYRYQKRIRRAQKLIFDAVLSAQIQEQERIARDLHDQIGPAFSIIKSQVSCFDDHSLNAEDKQLKNDILHQLTDTIQQVRSISHNLIPVSFKSMGLVYSLKNYLSQLSEYTSLHINYDIDAWPKGISKNAELMIFRILQELIQNTIKHSGATDASLLITTQTRYVHIHYSDTGCGISTNQSSGIGTKNIETRVNMLYGNYTLKTDSENGVSYHFTFEIAKLYE